MSDWSSFEKDKAYIDQWRQFAKGEIVEGSVLLVLIEDEIQLVFSEGHLGRDPRHAS